MPSSEFPALPSTSETGEYVTGAATAAVATPYTVTKVGDVMQHRGGVTTLTSTMNDQRVTGTATFMWSIDARTNVGPQ